MNIKKFYWCMVIFIFNTSYLIAQTDLINVTPLSPNAASFAKYIESPVGSFTGVPPISLPLFNIKTSDINIALSVSYHAGGNRVESIASWVGLGWNLNGIPSISRQVKHLKDEGTGGFFYKPATENETIKYIYENREVPGSAFYDFVAQAFQGLVDTEPDIFSFNLLNTSGKFFYNQETEAFSIIPRNNMRIIKSGVGNVGFVITDEQGITYHFDVLENTLVQGSTVNTDPPVTSTWYPSKIISSSGKDTIFFEYTTENQVFRSNFGSTFVIPLDNYGDLVRWTSNFNANSGYRNNFSNTYSTSKVPYKITYSQGTIEFIKEISEREDLEGGHRLESIVVKDYNSNIINQYNFFRSYLSTSFSYDVMFPISTQRERKYMLLDSLEEKAGYVSKKHAFKYNRENIPACRISTAQDEWGYYNGRIYNSTLVPEEYIMHYSLAAGPPPIKSDGSDRQVDTLYNQFGILESIIYPTGGKTFYEFETNKAIDPAAGHLRKYYKPESAAIEVATGQGQTWPITAFYQTSFTINNPPEYYLNNMNVNGGAFVHIDAGYFGCDLTNGSATCAQINIRKVNNDGVPVNKPVYANKANNTTDMSTYLPNGSYVIEATFNQDPPQYNNFYISLTWSSIDSTKDNSSGFAGGLRVKKISHFHSKDDAEPALKTEYKYTIGWDSTKSSGQIFSAYSPVFSKKVETITVGSYQQINANPTMQTILQSGSCVGYTKVFSIVKNTDQSKKSVIEKNYINVPDEFNTMPPFNIIQNNEFVRGNIESEVNYAFENNSIKKVAEKVFEYEYLDSVAKKPYSLNVDHYRLTWSDNTIPNPWSVGNVVYYSFYHYPTYSFLLKKETDRMYNSDNDSYFLETIKEYKHNPIYFHVNEDKTVLSNTDVKKNVYYRSYDLSGSDSYYQQLVSKNQVAGILKTETFVKDQFTQSSQVKFNTFGGIILPSEVFRKNKGGDNEKVIEFVSYNALGNIAEQNKMNDVKEVYLWGYKGQHPVAKILNTTYQVANTYVNQATLDNPANDNALRSHLANLRNIPGALVTIYTYKPLVGITSETDARGRVTYYEYDSFNRLYLVRDHDGNIIKKFCYNYAGEIENCNNVDISAHWEATGITRCQPCPQNPGYNTNILENQQKDNNPNSPTYNSLRWVASGISATCTVTADWKNTTDPVECKKDASNNNTGEQQQKQKDANPCSPTYEQYRWVVTGTNTTACPLPVVCNNSNCSGEGKKCVNGSCETGIKVYTSSYPNGGTQWVCIYHYEWSDGSWSGNYTEYSNLGSCIEEEG